jgi:hypothetical protein
LAWTAWLCLRCSTLPMKGVGELTACSSHSSENYCYMVEPRFQPCVAEDISPCPNPCVFHRLGPARFTKALELKKRRSARYAREWRRWCSCTPQNHCSGQLAAHIALGITWGGLAGDRGHRKGQLRVLGSPSARHTKEPRTGGAPGGAGSPRTRFFLRKSLRTYLRVLKPDCRPPGPLGTIPATIAVLGEQSIW